MPKPEGSLLSESMANSTTMSYDSSMETYTGTAKTISLSEIKRATDHFRPDNVVGEGGFGRVYQGVLDNGVVVAVKVLTRDDHQGGREFIAEVEMLSRLHGHRNLVKLIGICTEEIRCLVYELITNGSVESHLHGLDKYTGPLNWDARVKIALGSARGLAYLHEDSQPRVIHRDFKEAIFCLRMTLLQKYLILVWRSRQQGKARSIYLLESWARLSKPTILLTFLSYLQHHRHGLRQTIRAICS
ncbi:hypothetical protein M758_UG159900 [Ceratodon purpureus]|nr:hypothetical protein M758_UG159900 [Ceratodon purpureus]